VLVDRFLEDAVEIDVDAVSDGREIFSVIMEQVEHAGVHSGDSSCVYPPQTLSLRVISAVEEYTLRLARHLGVKGLLNVQYAVKDRTVYLLEANARASRTVPFASKATGVPLARVATRLIMEARLSDMHLHRTDRGGQVSVKAVVLPFNKFPGLEPLLGPEMQSTGESMGIGADFPEAFARAQQGAGFRPLAPSSSVLVAADGVAEWQLERLGRALEGCGHRTLATPITTRRLHSHGLEVERVGSVEDADSRGIGLIAYLNGHAHDADRELARGFARNAIERRIPYVTTLAGLVAWLGAGTRAAEVASRRAWPELVEGSQVESSQLAE
jgi:carbamoyl-phosphate synthase large subunit